MLDEGLAIGDWFDIELDLDPTADDLEEDDLLEDEPLVEDPAADE